jgi:hypothetical protein
MAASLPNEPDDLLITDELHHRIAHKADYQREKLAIQDLFFGAKPRNFFLKIQLSFLLQLALARRPALRDLDEIVRAKRPHPA